MPQVDWTPASWMTLSVQIVLGAIALCVIAIFVLALLAGGKTIDVNRNKKR